MDNPYKAPEADLEAGIPQVEGELNLASRGVRLGGSLIDGFVAGAPVIAAAFALGLYDNVSPDGTLPLADHLLLVFFGIAFFMVVNGFLIYRRGQTVGKMILGTRVVALDGTQVSGNKYVFLRLLPVWVVTQIPFVGSAVALIDSLLIFRKERNCLHDDIAKTRVIKL